MSKLPDTSIRPETTIRKLRRERGLTQAELAARTGLSENAIAKLDRGDHKPLHSTALILALVLHCAPADLRRDA